VSGPYDELETIGRWRPNMAEPTWRARWLGKWIRELREECGLKIEGVAEHLGKVKSVVSKFESGQNPIPGDDLLKLLDLFGVADLTQRADMLRLAKDVTQRGWWDNYEPYINRNFTDFLWLEDNAHTVNVFALTALPGLLQTREHMTALMAHGPESTDDLQMQRTIEARLMRHQVFDGGTDKLFKFLIHEPVLFQQVGGPATLLGQYEHLLEAIEFPQVELRILPKECWMHIAAGINTPFTHFQLPPPLPQVLCLDSPAGSKFLEAPELDSFTATYDALWDGDALDKAGTIERVKTLIKDVKK
jgi:transcriptional regulator with XRE-family HTH domain